MQFHVPQYIDIPDKLFGPLTLKQAIYVAGGLGGSYAIYKIIPYTFISGPLIVALALLTWALAFYPESKLGKPFIEVLESAIKYALGGKLYTWKKIVKKPEVGKEEEFITTKAYSTPAVPMGKLSSTSFDLGIRGLKKDNEVKEKEGNEYNLISTKISQPISAQPKNPSSTSFGNSARESAVTIENPTRPLSNISSSLKSLNLTR